MASQRRSLKFWLRWVGFAFAAAVAWILLSLAALRIVDPPTTGVQMQRRVESWFAPGKYQKRAEFVPLARISVPFQSLLSKPHITGLDGNDNQAR